ncbi:MAG TPA: formate dehydrogenase accessory protein FdhE, partial [Acidimicrobiia bacterium]|nr:formate dehydrogenase accessory protein FdhE [Acidimicrobiia bacterium]
MTFGSGARRGGPGDFEARRTRAEHLLAAPGGGGGAAGPLTLVASVLRLQAGRATTPAVVAAAGAVAAGADLRRAAGRFPLLDLAAAIAPIAAEIPAAVSDLTRRAVALPEPLAAAGLALTNASPGERESLVEAWLEDPAGPEAVLGFWARVAAAPVLEPARAGVATPGRDDWSGAACPACGGLAQASVIAEESGEFMGGSPRSLVCGRCAGWWTFPRAICTWCSEADPRRLPSFVPDERRAVRIDGCETCSSYAKTFDLREAGGAELVPLVDDVATVALD